MTLRLLAPWTVPRSVRSASTQKAPATIRIGASSSTLGGENSIRRLRRARAALTACGVLADGNRVLVHLGPHGKAAGSPSRTCAGAACLIGSLRAGQKVPRKAGLEAEARHSSD